MANGPYTGPLKGSTSQNYKTPELRFRAVLTRNGTQQVQLARV